MPDDQGALQICADARVLGATLKAGQRLNYSMTGQGYLVPTLGAVTVNGATVEAGDGVAMTQERVLAVEAIDDTEVILVEVF
jgi:redox-sensitive bicupin YhaK (pirin superfamily)